MGSRSDLFFRPIPVQHVQRRKNHVGVRGFHVRQHVREIADRHQIYGVRHARRTAALPAPVPGAHLLIAISLREMGRTKQVTSMFVKIRQENNKCSNLQFY